jgi:TRAP-type C4-dicarboxylate transport system substrate-binding protein
MTRTAPSTGRRLAAAALTALALLPALLPQAAQAKEFDLTMGVIVSPGDIYSNLTASLPERVSKATNGRVSVTVSDSLVAPAQIASAVREGRLPMSAAVHTYLAAEEPRMGIFNLPGLINTIDDYQKVRNAFWAQDVANIWNEKWNAKVLAEGAWCRTQLFSKQPIHSLADFRGKRLRVHNPQTAALVTALGARPTPMSAAEIAPGLERGVIDGAFISGCVGGAMEFPRYAPHVQDWGVGTVTGWAILINNDQWKKLPADVQGQVNTAMRQLEREAFNGYEAYVQDSLEKMKAKGAKVWVATPQQKAEINSDQYTKAVFDSWNQRAKEVGFDGPAYIQKVRTTLGR